MVGFLKMLWQVASNCFFSYFWKGFSDRSRASLNPTPRWDRPFIASPILMRPRRTLRESVRLQPQQLAPYYYLALGRGETRGRDVEGIRGVGALLQS